MPMPEAGMCTHMCQRRRRCRHASRSVHNSRGENRATGKHPMSICPAPGKKPSRVWRAQKAAGSSLPL